MMKLLQLTMSNFMPYKGEAVLKFPQDEMRNTLIVFGDNMRGKTSLLNAIRWVFYGYAFGRHLREIPLHLMPNKESAAEGDWRMEVRIEFEANGSHYDLRRVAEKRELIAIPEKPEDFVIETHMIKDGVALPGNEIDFEINKFSPEQVSRFFLFDGELLQEYEELLIEGSDQGKKIKQAIERALGVPAITNARSDLYTILKRFQKLQEKEATNVKGLEGIVSRQRDWFSKREAYEKDLKDLKIRHAAIQNERLEINDELEKYETVLTQKTELDEKEKRQKDIEGEIDSKTRARLELVGRAWKDLLSPKLKQKKAYFDNKQEELMDKIKLRSELETKINQLNSLLNNSTCPTCKRSMESAEKKSAEEELALLKGKLENYDDVVSSLSLVSTQVQSLSKLLTNGVVDRIQDVDRDLARLEHESSRVENRIEEIRIEIEVHDTESISRKRAKRDSLQKEESRLDFEIEHQEAEIEKADKELKIISQQISTNQSKMSTKGTRMATLCQSLHDIFLKSIDELRSSLRKEVEVKASESFQSMTTQSAYQGLKINENYGLKIIDHNGDEVELRSAGAEQIVALSLIDGLSRSGRGAGPVVMDTPFGRLDTKHRKNILDYLPKSASQLILFVHDGEIRGNDDLSTIAHRIGGQYEIKEVSPSHSVIEVKL